MNFTHIIQREVYFLGHCAQKPNGEHVPDLFVTSLFCFVFFFFFLTIMVVYHTTLYTYIIYKYI